MPLLSEHFRFKAFRGWQGIVKNATTPVEFSPISICILGLSELTCNSQ